MVLRSLRLLLGAVVLVLPSCLSWTSGGSALAPRRGTSALAAKGFGAKEPVRKTRDRVPGDEEPCACSSGLAYGACCKPYHEGEPAPSPLELLRSRYSAYAYRLPDYIMATTHRSNPDWKKSEKDRKIWKEDLLRFSDVYNFEGLDILSDRESADVAQVMAAEHVAKVAEEPDPDAASYLTFRARLAAPVEIGGGGKRLDFEERSLFLRIGGRWLYAHGDVDFEPSVSAPEAGAA